VDVSPLQHFWSLAVVVQFSLVLPVLLIAGSLAWARRGRPSGPAAAVLLTALTAASLALFLSPATASSGRTTACRPGPGSSGAARWRPSAHAGSRVSRRRSPPP
jgi:peptidoglycan/LPS O-acetylase OafA/YrhL